MKNKYLPDLDELQKLIPKLQLHIEEKDVKRTCSVCHKPYKDKQIIANGFAAVKYPLCTNCRKTYIRDCCERLNNEKM